MTTVPLDRQRAATRTRLAQAGVLVCVALGGGIAAFGLPGVKAPPPPAPLKLPDAPANVGGETPPEAAKPAANLAATAERLSLISNHPVQPKVEVAAVEPPKGAEAPPPAPAPVEDVKFLGIVNLGVSKMALVSKADKQFFVGQGGKIGEDILTEISDHEIKLGSKSITLAPKGTDMVSHSGSGPGGAAPMPGMPRQVGAAGQNRANNAALAALNASVAARNAAKMANPKGSQFQPTMGVPAAPFPDPVRNTRYQQMVDKLRKGGEFKSETDLAEAAMKMTDQEAISGQIPGFDPAMMKNVQK